MAVKPKLPSNSKKRTKKKVKYKYVIPDHISDCHISGVWGGLVQNGQLHMHLFNERPPIPNHVTVEVDKDGLATEVSVDAGGDIVRLIQASAVMDMHTAIAIRDWLDRMINKFEEQLPEEIRAQIEADRAKRGGKDAKCD